MESEQKTKTKKPTHISNTIAKPKPIILPKNSKTKESKYFPVLPHPTYLMKVDDLTKVDELTKVDNLVNSYLSKCFCFRPPAGLLVFWLRKMDFLMFSISNTFNQRALSNILILRAIRASDIHSAPSPGPLG